jgi:N-formylmaleamate deformylase
VSRISTSILVFLFSAGLGVGCAAPPAAAGRPVASSGPPPFQVKVVGHGPPMLLIPGLASSGEVWDGVVAHYQDHYTCHVFTLAGFAGTPARSGPFLVPERQALAAYIHDRTLEKPVVMAHSLGGVLALALAEEEPKLLGPLVIVDSLPFLPAARDPRATAQSAESDAASLRNKLVYASPEDRRRFQRISVRALVTSEENQERVAGWSMRSDVDTVGNALYEVMTTDLRPRLATIESPTLVLGTWAGYAPYQTREETLSVFKAQYAGLSGARVMVADHARHFVMLDDLSELLRATDGFLAAGDASHAR